MEPKKEEMSSEPPKGSAPPQYEHPQERDGISQAPLPDYENLPLYTEHNRLADLHNDLFRARMMGEDTFALWQDFLNRPGGKETLSANKDVLMSQFVSAIHEGEDQVVAVLIQSNLVSPNTSLQGGTPLLKAVATRNIKMVERLLSLGADRNAFGNVVC